MSTKRCAYIHYMYIYKSHNLFLFIFVNSDDWTIGASCPSVAPEDYIYLPTHCYEVPLHLQPAWPHQHISGMYVQLSISGMCVKCFDIYIFHFLCCIPGISCRQELGYFWILWNFYLPVPCSYCCVLILLPLLLLILSPPLILLLLFTTITSTTIVTTTITILLYTAIL